MVPNVKRYLNRSDDGFVQNPLQQLKYSKRSPSPCCIALDEQDDILQVKPSLPRLGRACFVMRKEPLQ